MAVIFSCCKKARKIGQIKLKVMQGLVLNAKIRYIEATSHCLILCQCIVGKLCTINSEGKFTQSLGGNILDIQSLNTYAYVKNNPLTYKDPDGLSPVSTAYTPYLTGEAPPTNTIPYAASWQGGSGQTSGASAGCIREKGYLERSVEQIVLGNFTDEVTLLGTAGQVALGVVGFDLPGDIRDIIADFANWEWSWWHVGQTLVDIVGVLPLVGVIKYADELGVLIKNGFKKLGNILETAKDAVKGLGDLKLFKGIKEFFQSGGDKAAKEVTEAAGDAVDDVIEGGTPIDIKNDILNATRQGSALKTDSYHGFNDIIDNYAGQATKTGLGNANLYQIDGSLNGVSGRFEWIIQNGNVTHRMFVPGGTMNGAPIKP